MSNGRVDVSVLIRACCVDTGRVPAGGEEEFNSDEEEEEGLTSHTVMWGWNR